MFMFVSAFTSNINIASVVMLTLTKKIGSGPILCVCVLLPLLLSFFKMLDAKYELALYPEIIGK